MARRGSHTVTMEKNRVAHDMQPLMCMVGQGRIELPTPGFSVLKTGNLGIVRVTAGYTDFKGLVIHASYWETEGKRGKRGVIFCKVLTKC